MGENGQEEMKISFFMPIFNGLTIPPKGIMEACINHIYDYAYEIIVVEGAAEKAIPMSNNGISSDGTHEWLLEYQETHEKLKTLIIKDGGWEDRQELHKASNGHFSGDYVWLLDCDEFYHCSDIERVIGELEQFNPPAYYFYANQFWGDFNHRISDETSHLWPNVVPWMRIFKNGPDSYWHGMRPPEYWYQPGEMCNQMPGVIDKGSEGVRIWHYSFVSKSQIQFKSKFFEESGIDYMSAWKMWQKHHSDGAILGTKTITVHPKEHPEPIKRLGEKYGYFAV